MAQWELNLKALKLLIVSGICIAILSAVGSRVEWISSFCGMFGNGCRETEAFTLFQIPVSLWGIGYYILLGLLLLYARPWVFWGVMGGVGVELAFIHIMVSLEFVCVFCLINLLIMGLLFYFILDKRRIWQALTISLFVFIVSGALLDRENLSGGAGDAGTGDVAVVAWVGDLEISRDKLEIPLAGRIYRLEKKIHQLKQDRLEELIDTALLEKDAINEGISREALERRILSQGTTVSNAEVDQYYRKNRAKIKKWKGSEEKLKENIRTYLLGQKKTKRIKDYTRPLKAKYGVTVFLKPPSLPLANVDIDNSPFSGPTDAPVTIVEFSDYMCPSCRRAHTVTKELRKEYRGKIKWVFKDYPLKRHEGADKLALAARCAGEQGKFWEYQDLLFEARGKQDMSRLIQYAERLELNVSQFVSSFESKEYIAAIIKDIQDAKAVGISSTPSFIINGRLHPGSLSREQFKKLIDEALKAVEL